MSNSTEEYMEPIYNLTQNGRPVSTSSLSRRLNIAPASVTEMIKKLGDDDYVNYSPYQGVTLTAKGLGIGERMTRKHRLLERFLHDMLKIGKEKVHAEACAMEHALSDEAERALCQNLKAPDKCPDDNKLIPPCNLNFTSCQECIERGANDFSAIEKRKCNVVALSALKKRQEGTIAFIRGEHRVLGRLRDMGLTPGTRVSVTRVAPLKGPIEISIRGSKLAISDAIAGNVFISKNAAEQAAP
jgi:DtxR family transcriptional regulator, Mn-dependent transcriptional regulator